MLHCGTNEQPIRVCMLVLHINKRSLDVVDFPWAAEVLRRLRGVPLEAGTSIVNAFTGFVWGSNIEHKAIIMLV